MDTMVFYNLLLDEINAEEAALSEKKALARLLQRRIALMTTAAPTPPPIPTLTRGSGKSFVQQVEEVLPALAGREFVVSDVAGALRDAGFELKEKPNPKITTVLTRLTTTGALLRTFTGAGNVPNRYRLAGGKAEAVTPSLGISADSHGEQEAPQNTAP